MTSVPPNLTPSVLSWCDELPSPIQALLENARGFRAAGEWARAESCALDARDASEKSKDQVGRAAALLHLADVYREECRPRPAQSCFEEARQIFRRQPPRIQRQNAAAATYGLGLTHQALGDDIEALSCYQTALDLFEKARKHWATRNDRAQIEICQQTQEWIKGLITRITDERTSGPPPHLRVFPIWRPDGAGAPFVEDISLEGHVTADRVLIKGTAYRIHPLPGQAEDLPVVGTGKVNCFTLPVQRDEWPVPEARIGDYVLIHQIWLVDKEKVGVVWEPDSGWIAVDFKRGPDDEFRFLPRPVRVIGGRPPSGDPTGRIKGYVIALLKREGWEFRTVDDRRR